MSEQNSAPNNPVPMAAPEPEPIRCRWCGKNEIIEGYHTCPNCHRVQNPILGRFQVFNAPSWLAVLVAALAAYAAFEQTEVARSERVDAQKAREEALKALEAAEKAGEGAEHARRGAEDARKSAITALDEIKNVRSVIGREASAIRLFQINTISQKMAADFDAVRLECSPPPADAIKSRACQLAMDQAIVTLHEAGTSLLLYPVKPLASTTTIRADMEISYCRLEAMLIDIGALHRDPPVCKNKVFQIDSAKDLHLRYILHSHGKP